MCLFPSPVYAGTRAFKYGIKEFECGSCPECMQKRASYWVLRTVAETRYRRSIGQSTCMVTLTYDNFARDDRGHLLPDAEHGGYIELPSDRSIRCDKRDVQLFMKRLRKKFGSTDIKYLATAEHGSRTGRAHYHVILFGVEFGDLRQYKKSKRGNMIYTSRTLSSLWKHGICTVDSCSVSGAVARYCTKYTLKQHGQNDTFQLFSHGIGFKWLCDHFTGRPYIIEGRQYPIPRTVWNWYIFNKYSQFQSDMSYRYVAKNKLLLHDDRYEDNHRKLEFMRILRDDDDVYSSYRESLSYNADLRDLSRPSPRERILSLDQKKYGSYRHKALNAMIAYESRVRFSNDFKVVKYKDYEPYRASSPVICRKRSCHITANDTFSLDLGISSEKVEEIFLQVLDKCRLKRYIKEKK